MTLDNLVAIGKLLPVTPSKVSIDRLMQAAARNLADARVIQVSPDTRFDAAYKAIMQCSMAALAASGFRTSQSQPGHHQTAIQCLVKTVGIDTETLILLDALRKKRNVSDYEGDPVSGPLVDTCIHAASSLLSVTQAWLHGQGALR